VRFSTDNRQLVEMVARGTTPIVFGAIQTEVERFRKAGFSNLAVVLPDDAPGYLTGGYSVLKQAKGVPHPNAATVFINWYMSRPGQEVYESVMLETSCRADLNTGLPDYLVPRPGRKYYEAFNEYEYFSRNAVVKLITDALGSR
jgi:iron(III) transport system substrate-binding protein